MSQDPREEDNQQGNNLGKLAAGAAIIGGIAATAAVLSNKDVRDKIADGVEDVQARGAEVIAGLQEQFEDLRDKITQGFANSDTGKLAAELKERLDEIGGKLTELKDASADDAQSLLEDVQSRIDALRSDYESASMASE